jgi:hypothetical protein
LGALTRAAFLDGIAARLRRELPEQYRGFRTRRFGHLMKIYFDNERVHYEVWVDTRRAQVEVGLHLEDGPGSTLVYLALLDRHILEIKHVLGPQAELGRWTQSWGHLIETWPLVTLDDGLRTTVGERARLYIETLQPLLEEAGRER